MLLRTPCIARIARTRPRRTQWRPILMRCYASTAADDPPWFQQLRDEMLQRDMTHLPEHITAPTEYKLSQTLYGSLPKELCQAPGFRNPGLPVGHHLIWFNPSLPTRELLPDGTDASQSPGSPWVRRMWAGGSIQLRSDDYYDKARGLTLDTAMVGAERIKDVRLRGQDDAAKIFVTIERRFARLDRLKERYRDAHGSLGRASGLGRSQRYFEEQIRQDEGWGDAILKEERNLVFMKERTAAELEAIKAGNMAAVKYLDPPGEPQFSHTITPDRALLFRFSALTFNAHLIHLDRDHARNVEGHRNLLVHGPLSLILMLKAINSHVSSRTDGKQVVESIEYRNLAPLYCDEEMRICGLEKKALHNGSIYDVWIEGPTGGVAVKGTVYTTVRNVAPTPPPAPTHKAKGPAVKQSRNTNRAERPRNHVDNHPAFRRVDIDTTRPEAVTTASLPAKPVTPELETALGLDQTTSEVEQPSQSTATPPTKDGLPTGEKPEKSILQEPFPQPSSREVAASIVRAPSRAYRRDRPTSTRSHQFVTSIRPTGTPPPIRLVNTVRPVKVTVSLRSRHIFRRIHRRTQAKLFIKPISILRMTGVTPYTLDPDRTAARHSRFLQEGTRNMEKPRIRVEGESLEKVDATQRWGSTMSRH